VASNLSKPSSSLSAAVMGVLFAHPHDDTPGAIWKLLGDPSISPGDIVGALRELDQSSLVRGAGGHWQLSTAGYRALRRPAA
jgi:hypothetical protein